MKLQKTIMIRLVLLSYGISCISANEVAKAEAKAESSTQGDTHQPKECAGEHDHLAKSTAVGDVPGAQPKSAKPESPSEEAKPIPPPKGHKSDLEASPKVTKEQTNPVVSTNKGQSKQGAGPIPHSDEHVAKNKHHDSDKTTEPESSDKESDPVPSHEGPDCDSKSLTEERKKEDNHEAPSTVAQPRGKSLSPGASSGSEGQSKLEQPETPSEEPKSVSSQTNPIPPDEDTEVKNETEDPSKQT